MEHILSTAMGNYSGKKFCLNINAAKVTSSASLISLFFFVHLSDSPLEFFNVSNICFVN